MRDAVALLERTRAVRDGLLRKLPDSWTQTNEGPDTWTVVDVVGHLIHAERRDWMPRVTIILEPGETRAFEPFDRLAQRNESAGRSLPEMLNVFASLRRESLE